MLYGDNKPYNVALVVARSRGDSKVGGGAQHHRSRRSPRTIAFASWSKRSSGSKRAAFKGFERPQKFVIASDDFTVENGMLTPTLKLKRRKVLERYGADLEASVLKRGRAVLDNSDG